MLHSIAESNYKEEEQIGFSHYAQQDRVFKDLPHRLIN